MKLNDNIEPPIFAFAKGQTIIFRTQREAVGYLEPPDLEYNNDEIYDSSGGLLDWETASIWDGQMIVFTEIDRSSLERIRFRLRLIEALLSDTLSLMDGERLFQESTYTLKELNIKAHGFVEDRRMFF